MEYKKKVDNKLELPSERNKLFRFVEGKMTNDPHLVGKATNKKYGNEAYHIVLKFLTTALIGLTK